MKFLKCAGFLSALNVGLTTLGNNVIKDENEVYKRINSDLTTTGVNNRDEFWDSKSPSFAKINLTLNIDSDSKVTDRYLKLCSLMQKVAWGNEIFIKRITNEESKLVSKEYLPTSDGDYLMLIDDTPEASGVRNALTIANFPFDSSNILAKTLAKIRGSDENYIVLTRKVIPIGTGLGGGSSDAAVLINCLNGAVNSEEIVKIGSDVPFLAHNCNAAIVSGIGDKIHEIELNGYNDWVYILIPQELVSTKDIFCKARELLSSGKFHKNTRLFERNLEFVKGFNSLASGDDLESSETLGNDMEGCIINGNVLKLHNLLKNLLHGKCFGMSGSGSSFFVLGTNDDVMKQIRHTYGSPLIIVKTRFKSEGNNHVFEYL